MPDVDAISVARHDHIPRVAARFAVREVATQFDEPVIILEDALPLGQTLLQLEEIGMEAAGGALLSTAPDAALYALYAQGAVEP